MKKPILASESFSSHKRHYFLDFKSADNNSNYIQITLSEQQADDTNKRWQVIVFENDFENFISAFSFLFQSAAYQGEGYKTIQKVHEELKAPSGIKAMDAGKRPREKLLAQGRRKMSHAELLAMLIGSGTSNESAVELADHILQSVGKRLSCFKELTLAELCKFNGMGVAKSSAIIAALELARRIYDCPRPEFKTEYLVRKPGDDPDNFFKFN